MGGAGGFGGPATHLHAGNSSWRRLQAPSALTLLAACRVGVPRRTRLGVGMLPGHTSTCSQAAGGTLCSLSLSTWRAPLTPQLPSCTARHPRPRRPAPPPTRPQAAAVGGGRAGAGRRRLHRRHPHAPPGQCGPRPCAARRRAADVVRPGWCAAAPAPGPGLAARGACCVAGARSGAVCGGWGGAHLLWVRRWRPLTS